MTPVFLLLTSVLLSLFWEKNGFKEITLTSLKGRRTRFPFLDAEMQLRLKLHVIELEKIYSSVFLLWTIFIHNIFLKTGSLMIACERELKLSNHYNKNASIKWHLIFLQNSAEFFKWLTWHAECHYLGVKFQTQILHRLEKKRKMSKKL